MIVFLERASSYQSFWRIRWVNRVKEVIHCHSGSPQSTQEEPREVLVPSAPCRRLMTKPMKESP